MSNICDRLVRCLVPSALCLLIVLGGCGKADPYSATERAIRKTLPEYIGPAAEYKVRISRSDTNLLGGKIGWVEIQGRGVRAAETLTVDELEVRLDQVRFNRGDRSIRSVGASAITARISAASATRYVTQRGPQYAGTRFEFLGDEAVVHATPALLGIRVPVKVSGRPLLHGEQQIDFDTSHLSVSILPLPSPVLSLLERRINPILDLTALHLPLHLTGVHIEPGFAVITGTALLPTAP
jgi:LmeA-like phospholipid-binding